MSEDEDVNLIAPLVCPTCGHTFMVPVETGKNICPFCGNCVECG